MKRVEIEKQLNMSYKELVLYLQEKYGMPEHNYFKYKDMVSVNPKISRTSEGLFCHHVDEDKAIMLSSPKYAQLNPYEYQLSDRLVYCNFLEHLILHIKIVLEPRHIDANKNELPGIGGIVNFICPQINDFYSGVVIKRQYLINAYELIKDNYDDYVYILRYFFFSLSKSTNLNNMSLKRSVSYNHRLKLFEKLYEELLKPDPDRIINNIELENLKKEASNGIFEAQIKLADLYHFGNEVEYDFEKSFYWAEKAIEKCDLDTQFNLARRYLNVFERKDIAAVSINWLKKLGELGHLNSMRKLITLSSTNEEDFLRWVFILILNKDEKAKDELISQCINMLNRSKNIDNIVSLMIKKTENKEIDFLSELITIANISFKQKQTPKLILKWLEEKSIEGDPKFQYILGVIYSKLRKTKSNIDRIIDLFTRSSNSGNSDAIRELGNLYYEGIGFEGDRNKAVELYEKSANMNNVEAMIKLAEHFKSRKAGINKNFKTSLYWYERAAENNSLDAILELIYHHNYGNIRYDMEPATNLKELYIKAAKLGNREAFNILRRNYKIYKI